jgi:glycosyltransferase involved in cell wall biosynthesis
LVIAHLAQGGSERWVYEFSRALDRSRFELEVLTKRRPRAIDIYEGMLEKLGVRLHRKLPLLLQYTRRIAGPLYRIGLFRAIVDLPHRIHARFTMGRLLDEFDVIYVIQIENYYLVQPLVADNRRVITHLMSSAFQYRVNPYNDCRPDRRYRFIIYDPTQIADFSRSSARDADTLLLPHALDLSGRADLTSRVRTTAPFRIAVFQRLHRERQFGGLFQAFRTIAKAVDARLVVYGRGNPEQFDAELDSLGIRDRVEFPGHADSIEAVLASGAVSLVLSTSNNAVLGYGSIEVASFGFPAVFWSVGTDSHEDVLAASRGAIHSHTDPEETAAEALSVLQSPEKLREIGQNLRRYVVETYDIKRHIRALERTLEGVVERSSS